jgi:hypothetical protein
MGEPVFGGSAFLGEVRPAGDLDESKGHQGLQSPNDGGVFHTDALGKRPRRKGQVAVVGAVVESDSF